jgi:hypothetical protein
MPCRCSTLANIEVKARPLRSADSPSLNPCPTERKMSSYKDVYAIAVASDRVFLGGEFASINGVARTYGLAAVNKTGISVSAPVLTTPTGSERGPYTFSGTVAPGVAVILYDGPAVAGKTVAAGDGAWSISTSSQLAIGTHNFTAVTAPVFQAGMPSKNESAASNTITLAITGAVINPTGQTFTLKTTGTGQCTNNDSPCTGYEALYIDQDGSGDILNLVDPPSAVVKDSTNSRTLVATGASPQNSATLQVTSYDCDWPGGEWDYIYLNGHALGRLTGTSDTWNTTFFTIPDLSWINNGNNIVQVRVTDYGETLYHTWILHLASFSLIIDGGAKGQGWIKSLTAPDPVAGTITNTVVITTSASPASQTYRLETQLVNPQGDAVASVVSANLVLGANAIYTATPSLTWSAADYTGYHVVAVLYYLGADLTWVPQNSRSVTIPGQATAVTLVEFGVKIGSQPIGLSPALMLVLLGAVVIGSGWLMRRLIYHRTVK